MLLNIIFRGCWLLDIKSTVGELLWLLRVLGHKLVWRQSKVIHLIDVSDVEGLLVDIELGIDLGSHIGLHLTLVHLFHRLVLRVSSCAYS